MNEKTVLSLDLINGDDFILDANGVKEIVAEFYVNTPMSVEVYYENGAIEFYPHHQIAKVVFVKKQ